MIGGPLEFKVALLDSEENETRYFKGVLARNGRGPLQVGKADWESAKELTESGKLSCGSIPDKFMLQGMGFSCKTGGN